MKRCVHIVTVDQGEQTLRGYVQVDELEENVKAYDIMTIHHESIIYKND